MKSGNVIQVICLWILLFMICAINPLSSDVVVLKNGTRLEGITESVPGEPNSIVIRMGSGSLKISQDRIQEIIDEPVAIGHLKIAEQHLRTEDYDLAIDQLREALALDPTLTRAQDLLRATEEMLNRMINTAREENIQQINDLIEKIRLSLQKNEYSDALNLLNQVEELKPADYQSEELKKLKIDTLLGLGVQQIDRFNEIGAVESFQNVLSLDPDNKTAQKNLIQIWERDPSKLDTIIKAYEQILISDPGNKEIKYKLANALYDKEQWERAADLYLELYNDSTLNKDFIRTRLRQTLNRIHGSAAQSMNYEKAKEYYKKLLAVFPDEDPTVLSLYEYAERKSKTDPDDIEGRLQLAQFARENNLPEFAEQEYNEVLQREPDNEKALEGLTFYAQKQLEEAQFFFDNGQYTLAMRTGQKILDKYARLTPIVEKAGELIERSNNELRRLARQREAEAKDLAQRGNEYFQRAEQHIAAMRSTDIRSNVRVVSDREEAKKYLRRAITAWENALEIDPSLGDLASEDLRNKLNDANARLRTLESPVPMKFPLPRRPR